MRISDWISYVCSSDLCDHRRAAIRNERQRYAFGRNEVDVDRHIDERLQSEQCNETAGGELNKEILLSHRTFQSAQHDEGEDADDQQTGDDTRSEERRVGKPGVSTLKYRW